MKFAMYILIATAVMSVVALARTLPIGVYRNDGGAGGVPGNLLHRIRKSIIHSGNCPDGMEKIVLRGRFLGCRTREEDIDYADES